MASGFGFIILGNVHHGWSMSRHFWVPPFYPSFSIHELFFQSFHLIVAVISGISVFGPSSWHRDSSGSEAVRTITLSMCKSCQKAALKTWLYEWTYSLPTKEYKKAAVWPLTLHNLLKHNSSRLPWDDSLLQCCKPVQIPLFYPSNDARDAACTIVKACKWICGSNWQSQASSQIREQENLRTEVKPVMSHNLLSAGCGLEEHWEQAEKQTCGAAAKAPRRSNLGHWCCRMYTCRKPRYAAVQSNVKGSWVRLYKHRQTGHEGIWHPSRHRYI